MDQPTIDEAMLVDPALCTPLPDVADALDRPDQSAAALTLLAPAADTHRPLELLRAARLSDAGLIDAVIACERQLAALAALQQRFLAELAARDPDGERYLRDEVPCALKVAPVTGNQRLDVAVQLTGRLFETQELLAAGRISYAHARILASATDTLSDEVTAKVQARVLRRAEAQTPGEFRAAVRRAVAAVDRKTAAERHLEAYADRKVVQYPEPDAMASIWLHLAADGAATVMTAINACAATHARPGTPAPRTSGGPTPPSRSPWPRSVTRTCPPPTGYARR